MKLANLRVALVVVVLLLLAGCYPPPLAGVSPPATSQTFLPSASTGATPVPTIEASPTTALAATVVALSPGETRNSLVSPDSRWRVELIVHECVQTAEGKLGFDELRLTDAGANSTQTLAHQLRNCEGLGAFGLDALWWSANSRYLYYTDAREGVPDGGCGTWLLPIFRLDVATMSTGVLQSALASPDRGLLLGRQGQTLVVWDVEQGDRLRIDPQVQALSIGSLAWSPGGERFAYVQSEQSCPPYGRTTITVVDVRSEQQTLLLDSAERGYGEMTWETPGQLTLIDDQGQRGTLDVAAGD